MSSPAKVFLLLLLLVPTLPAALAQTTRLEPVTVARGLVHPDGRLTMAGIQTRTAVEDATDRAARRAWGALDDAERAHVVEALRPVGALVEERTPIRVPNPMGWEPL